MKNRRAEDTNREVFPLHNVLIAILLFMELLKNLDCLATYKLRYRFLFWL